MNEREQPLSPEHRPQIRGDFLDTRLYNANDKPGEPGPRRILLDLREVAAFTEGWPLAASDRPPHSWTQVCQRGGSLNWCIDLPFEVFLDLWKGWMDGKRHAIPA